MSGLSINKADREASRKAKQQRKQEKRNERKHATAEKAITENPGAADDLAAAETRRCSVSDLRPR